MKAWHPVAVTQAQLSQQHGNRSFSFSSSVLMKMIRVLMFILCLVVKKTAGMLNSAVLLMRTSLKRTLRRLVAGLCHSLLRNFQHRTDASRGKQPKVDYPAQMKNDAAFVADLFLRFVFYKHLASGVLYAMFINKLYCVVLERCVNIVTERNT